MICRTAAMAAMQFLMPDWRPDAVGYVDSATLPIRCHYADESDADLCNVLLGYAEESWEAQVNRIGFRAPLPDDDDLLDLYLSDDGTDGGAYTYGPYEDEDTSDGAMGCHAYMVVDPGIPLDEMKLYVSHEFNHVLQFATDFAEPRLVMWEATAESAMFWTYPDEQLVTYEAKDFQKTPWMGLLGDGYVLWDDYDLWSYYEYGAALWTLYLDATFGDGAGAAGAAWWEAGVQEGWANEPDMLDATDAITGDWKAALMEFSVLRARIGTDLAPEWADHLPASTGVDVDMSAAADELPVELVPTVGPYPTGVVYASVEGLAAGEVVKATLVAEKAELTWGMVVIEDGADASASGTEITWTAAGGTVTIGAVNFGSESFDADQTIRPASMVLRIERVGEPDTAGETGGDDSATPDSDPIVDEVTGAYGGGCSTGGAGGLGAALLGLALVSRRRSRG